MPPLLLKLIFDASARAGNAVLRQADRQGIAAKVKG
jgi:hypothetical protein